MIRKEDVIKMIEDWKKRLGKGLHDETLEVVLELVLKKIQAIPTVSELDRPPEDKCTGCFGAANNDCGRCPFNGG